jgi:hypothetical protein
MTPQNPAPQSNPDPIRDLLDEKTLADEITKAIEGNDCPRESDLLAYVKKQLGEAERIEVKSHLVFCNRCQGKVKLLEETPDAKGEAADGKDRGSSPSDPLRRRSSGRRKAIAASAFALELAGGVLLLFDSGGLPYGVKVVHAMGKMPGAEEIQFQVHTPDPPTSSDHGQRRWPDHRPIPPGSDGTSRFVDGTCPVQPGPRETDLYLVPISVGEATEPPAERSSQVHPHREVLTARTSGGDPDGPGVHHLKFIHEVFNFKADPPQAPRRRWRYDFASPVTIHWPSRLKRSSSRTSSSSRTARSGFRFPSRTAATASTFRVALSGLALD